MDLLTLAAEKLCAFHSWMLLLELREPVRSMRAAQAA
jgi:hypothetical protein